MGQKSSRIKYVSVCALEVTEITGGGLPLERQPAYLKIEKGTILHFNFNLDFYESKKVIRYGEEEGAT